MEEKWEEVYQLCKKEVTPKEISYSRGQLSDLKTYLEQKLLSQRRPRSGKELKRFVYKEKDGKAEEYTKIGEYITGAEVQVEVCQYSLENWQRLREMLTEIQEEKKREESQKPEKKEIGMVQLSKSFLKDTIKQMQENHIPLTFENIRKVLKNSEQYFKKTLKGLYIKELQLVGDYLKQYDLLEKYSRFHDSYMRRIGIKQADYPRDETGKLDYLFSSDYLETLPLEELNCLNIFWQNRYAKELGHMDKAIYLFEEEDWEEIARTGKVPTFSSSQIEERVVEYQFLDHICKYILRNAEENGRKIEVETELLEKVKKAYQKYFSKGMSEEKIGELIEERMLSTLHREDVYHLKNNLSSHFIRSMLQNKKIQNWGVVPEETTKKADGELVTIAVDYPQYSMPMTIHIKKQAVKIATSFLGREPVVPIYEGIDDYKLDGRMIPNHIFIKFSSEQKKQIKKELKETSRESPCYFFLAHSNFLATGNFPEHLKTVIQEKGRTILVRNRKHRNVVTGEILREKEQGKKEEVGER